jgi:hypothetical protein
MEDGFIGALVLSGDASFAWERYGSLVDAGCRNRTDASEAENRSLQAEGGGHHQGSDALRGEVRELSGRTRPFSFNIVGQTDSNVSA